MIGKNVERLGEVSVRVLACVFDEASKPFLDATTEIIEVIEFGLHRCGPTPVAILGPDKDAAAPGSCNPYFPHPHFPNGHSNHDDLAAY